MNTLLCFDALLNSEIALDLIARMHQTSNIVAWPILSGVLKKLVWPRETNQNLRQVIINVPLEYGKL